MANLLEVLGIRPEELNGVKPAGWRAVDEPLPQGRLVSDTTGPFPQNQRFADVVRNYDALFRNVEHGGRVETPRTPVLQSAVPEPMSLDKMLRATYGAAMTPLPPPPQLDLSGVMKKLRAARAAIPDIPELPTAPEWVKRYAREQGLERP